MQLGQHQQRRSM